VLGEPGKIVLKGGRGEGGEKKEKARKTKKEPARTGSGLAFAPLQGRGKNGNATKLRLGRPGRKKRGEQIS